MSDLLNEISDNYLDANGLVSPKPCKANEFNVSGNGVMYTSELMVLLRLRNELTVGTADRYLHTMFKCICKGSNYDYLGLLRRNPGQNDLTGPDDHIGASAGCTAAQTQSISQCILNYGIDNFGSFNTERPGKWTFKSFLWRQPQLLAAAMAATGRQPLWIYPFNLATALVIAFSCWRTPIGDQDARRLSWLLIYTMKDKSFLCRQAAKIWYKRLYRDYGPNGMKEVYRTYYGEDHPFYKYFPVGAQ